MALPGTFLSVSNGSLTLVPLIITVVHPGINRLIHAQIGVTTSEPTSYLSDLRIPHRLAPGTAKGPGSTSLRDGGDVSVGGAGVRVGERKAAASGKVRALGGPATR